MVRADELEGTQWQRHAPFKAAIRDLNPMYEGRSFEHWPPTYSTDPQFPIGDGKFNIFAWHSR